MTLIKLLTTPIRRLANFSLFQFCIVVLIIFLLQAAPDTSLGGEAFNGLDKLVSASITLIANAIDVKSFTRSLLTFGLMMVYVYVVYLLALAIARRLIRRCVDFAGRHNFLGLRNAIARERGIAGAERNWACSLANARFRSTADSLTTGPSCPSRRTPHGAPPDSPGSSP